MFVVCEEGYMMNYMVFEWYGCNNEVCVKTGWYHFDCLSEREKKLIRESLDDDVLWYCKACFPRFYEEE